MAEPDLIVIGAGAAGIGAAREARRLGQNVLVVEAGETIGGRARTMHWNGHALDLGCGWLHSATRNGWTAYAENQNIAVARLPAPWFEQYRHLGFPREEQIAAGAASDAFEARLRDEPPASDRAVDALAPGEPFNAYLDALSGYLNGTALEHLSIADYLAYEDHAGEENRRLPGGYGALVQHAARDLDVRTGVAVRSVERTAAGARVATDDGSMHAGKVVVAVPTSVLARGDIAFFPEIEGVREAASVLPLGLANKAFFALDDPQDFPNDAHLIGNPHDPETGSYMLNPLGMPVVEAFFGGRGAEDLEAAGEAVTFDFAIRELTALLGRDFGRRLHPIAASAWGRDAHIGGSYSHACPGHADARARLRAAGDERIAFAGEACSAHDFSTAHGALENGREAVRRLFGADRALEERA